MLLNPDSLAIESLWEDHYYSGWLLLVAGCLWPYQANPALWHFHSLLYFWAGTGLCQQPGCHRQKSAGPGADEVKRVQRFSPGQEEDHKQCPGSCTHPQSQGSLQICTVESGYRKDFQFLHICWSSAQGFQNKKTHPAVLPGFPLHRPPWWPLRPHTDSSIWVWDGASEKAFPRVVPQPSAEVVSGRLSVCHGHLLYSTSGRKSWVPWCDWVSLGIAVTIRHFIFTREGKTPKKQTKDTASVMTNPVHFLISALISQKSLWDLMLLQKPDREGDKADEWQPRLKSPPTSEAHSLAE